VFRRRATGQSALRRMWRASTRPKGGTAGGVTFFEATRSIHRHRRQDRPKACCLVGRQVSGKTLLAEGDCLASGGALLLDGGFGSSSRCSWGVGASRVRDSVSSAPRKKAPAFISLMSCRCGWPSARRRDRRRNDEREQTLNQLLHWRWWSLRRTPGDSAAATQTSQTCSRSRLTRPGRFFLKSPDHR